MHAWHDGLRWTNALVGLWIAIAPLFTGHPLAITNNFAVGGAMVLLAISGLRVSGWIIGVLGIWEMTAPFLLGYRGWQLYHDLELGFVIWGLGIALAFTAQKLSHPSRP